jgi:hypothetical protein
MSVVSHLVANARSNGSARRAAVTSSEAAIICSNCVSSREAYPESAGPGVDTPEIWFHLGFAFARAAGRRSGQYSACRSLSAAVICFWDDVTSWRTGIKVLDGGRQEPGRLTLICHRKLLEGECRTKAMTASEKDEGNTGKDDSR